MVNCCYGILHHLQKKLLSTKEGPISQRKLTGEEAGFPTYYAHNYGVAKWYVNGNFSQSDEGNYYGGKRHGEIIQRFADGRVIKSFWASWT